MEERRCRAGDQSLCYRIWRRPRKVFGRSALSPLASGPTALCFAALGHPASGLQSLPPGHFRSRTHCPASLRAARGVRFALPPRPPSSTSLPSSSGFSAPFGSLRSPAASAAVWRALRPCGGAPPQPCCARRQQVQRHGVAVACPRLPPPVLPLVAPRARLPTAVPRLAGPPAFGRPPARPLRGCPRPLAALGRRA